MADSGCKEEKERIRRSSSPENSVKKKGPDNMDWDKLLWDLVWVIVPLLLLCWAYHSVNHVGWTLGSYYGVRELVAFTGGVWVGIWMMAYPRLSYKI